MLGDSNIHTNMYRCVCDVCMKIYHCLSVYMYMCVPILVLVYVCMRAYASILCVCSYRCTIGTYMYVYR